MESTIKNILEKDDFTKEDIISLLQSEGEERTHLFKKSSEIKLKQFYFKSLTKEKVKLEGE